ncbi:glycosyltransferase family 4 protein [Planctomycetes bacterium K23_9]|uniref:D-inositol-3-phosphate glycosyltransferase n=1 Tax=Stieleria marina TaxID=1930275 RepID=A0A517NP70_9BACT|nr:D-inositol-3-phosphate glycosyltransferase [Planctomycetes bacterium K23_9]
MISRFKDSVPALRDAHVVVLTNYLRRHHSLVLQEVTKQVGKLTILLSTDMEPDRAWQADWGDLNVRIQKNKMITARWKHSSGFNEPNFIHIPTDTVKTLKELKPDIVFSYEMGMRTVLSSLYRLTHRKVPLVMVGNMADHIENERGMLRRLTRRFIKSRVDYATYNGPSCKRYLESIGFAEERLFHFPYCIDHETTYGGAQTFSDDGHRRLFYCGVISDRKGILPFTQLLADYLSKNDHTRVTLAIAGDGPLADQVKALQSDRLEIDLLGHCNSEQLSAANQAADICVFPTLGDEWGLVPIEAMASGLPVLGSVLAQSVEAKVIEGKNGWRFDPLDDESIMRSIDTALRTSQVKLAAMSDAARTTAADATPANSADCFCNVVRTISGKTA